MALTLKDSDHDNYDLFIEKILDSYAAGDLTKSNITGVLGHLLAAAAKDNSQEIKTWTDPHRFDRWLEECKKANGDA